MIPPNHVLDKLQSLDHTIRLGWWAEAAGGKDTTDDKDNRGCFVLLQLFHKRDADNTFLSVFDAGPVYGKPYDVLMRQPILIKCYSKQEVFNSDIIGEVITMKSKTVRERYNESAIAKGKYEADSIADLGGQAGEDLWRRHGKRDNASNVAKKFIKPMGKLRDPKDRTFRYVQQPGWKAGLK